MASEPYLVFRGGCYDSHRPSDARVAYRFLNVPDFQNSGLGVRLFRIANPLQQLAEVSDEK